MSRRELAGDELFERVSPEVGEFDDDAFDEAMANDPDAALALVATLTAAVDERLRERARQVARRVVIASARSGVARRGRPGRLVSAPFAPGGDLDVDAAVEARVAAGGGVPAVDDLRVIEWERPDLALCVMVDRSGSMRGDALATAAMTAAVVALRATGEYALVTFAGDVEVVRPMAASDPSPDVGAGVVDAVLALRGHGTTDVAGALLAGAAQLARSRAGRRVGVLLSDARATEPGDVVAAGRAYDELVIIAPDDDADEARSVGAAIGARVVTWTGPSQIPVVLRDALV